LRGDELVVTRAIQIGETLAGITIAVGDAIGVVDAGILHLDDEEKVSGGDCGSSAGGCSHGN
jgi:hypothetical protein